MKKKYQLTEFIFACFCVAVATYMCGFSFFSCDNALLISTTDAVPIFTKARYVAECLRNGNIPDWYPNWYCGTSVCQYYPPLTYVILAPLDFFLNNTTLCLKIYIFSGMFIGGIGVWYLYNCAIGRFWGISAAVLYVLLPYYAISFFFWGTVAQVPVVAVAPWYVLAFLRYIDKPKSIRLLWIIILTFILLLAHIMHAFLIVLSIFVSALILALKRKDKIYNLIMFGVGAGLAAGLLSFWWVTGVLPLENPGVPALASDTAKDVTANFTWFFNNSEQFFGRYFPDMKNNIEAYFPISVIIIAVFSVIFIRYEKGTKKYVLSFLYVHTIFTAIFSFGSYLPFYRFIPLANQLVPGRILTQTGLAATILTVYFSANMIYLIFFHKNALIKVFSTFVTFCIILSLIKTYINYPTDNVTSFSIENEIYDSLDTVSDPFEKGRIAWYGENFGSINAYYPCINKYNIVSGWNIEGTSTADYLRFQNIALKFKKLDYILKNSNDMNIQTCLVNTLNFPWLSDYLQQNGFNKRSRFLATDILERKEHSYFSEQIRDCIVIGKSSNIFLLDFPWFVKGYSNSPTDYSDEYLNYFNTIYYCEPDLTSVSEIEKFENQIKKLAKNGKRVFVEFGRTIFPSPILGVANVSFDFRDKFKVESNDELNGQDFFTGYKGGNTSVLYGLDTSLYKLRGITQPTLENTIVGTKKIDGTDNDVYFIGGPITQAKTDSINYYMGSLLNEEELRNRDEIIQKIYNKIFNSAKMYKKLQLPAFNAQNCVWDYKGCKFTYNSNIEKRVMISVTYSPRWKLYADNDEIPLFRVDNMLCANLPAGQHDIKLVYGTTIYSKIGQCMSAFSLMCLIILMIFHNWIMNIANNSIKSIRKYLEIPSRV